jgi:hypothetical protein
MPILSRRYQAKASMADDMRTDRAKSERGESWIQKQTDSYQAGKFVLLWSEQSLSGCAPLLNDAMNLGVPEKLQECGQTVIRILDRGVWEEEEPGAGAWAALGVSELDLGMILGMEPTEDEETQSP